MTNEESKALARTKPVEGVRNREPQTPPRKNAGGKENKTSPEGQTPSKKLNTVHGLDLQLGAGGEVDEAAEVEKDSAVRMMMSTRVWNVDENVFNLVGSALWKMNETSMDDTRIGNAQMVIQVTEDSFFWCKRPEAAASDKLQWKRVPTSKKLLLLEDLGVGRSGRVWLVCSPSGRVGVLKFSVVVPGEGSNLTVVEFRKEHVQKELGRWRKFYPKLGEMCRVQKFAGHWALLMPHLCTPKRNEATLELVEQTLKNCFVAQSWKHGDVAWRNIGMYKDGGGREVCVVFDLEEVTECNSGDWVAGVIEELRQKTKHS